jgi:DNA (cytosine-5)-methyltransferase 1
MQQLAKTIQIVRESRQFTQKELAELSGVKYSTITKLESGVYTNPTLDTIVKISNALEVKIEHLVQTQTELDLFIPPPIKSSKVLNSKFTFIDLFAGIGGFRIAFEELGGGCVFSSEWDKYCQKTYQVNFGEIPHGDITKISEKDVPDHDVLTAGFPCQAFSIAGKRGGFNDTRGTLFFDVARIIKEKRPKAFFLENVKGFANHDRGRTLATILNVLRNDLGYYVPEPQIMNAKNFGVPQNRERVFIAGFRNDLGINEFNYPKPVKQTVKVKDILEEKVVASKYYLSDVYMNSLREHKKRHEKKGNGFGYEIIDSNGIANAIVVGGMGRERNLVIDDRLIDFTPTTKIKGEINREGIRKMTPREWARLQGFPDTFIIPVSDAQAYKQFGNSVAVPAIKAMAKQIINIINKNENEKDNNG